MNDTTNLMGGNRVDELGNPISIQLPSDDILQEDVLEETTQPAPAGMEGWPQAAIDAVMGLSEKMEVLSSAVDPDRLAKASRDKQAENGILATVGLSLFDNRVLVSGVFKGNESFVDDLGVNRVRQIRTYQAAKDMKDVVAMDIASDVFRETREVVQAEVIEEANGVHGKFLVVKLPDGREIKIDPEMVNI